METGVEFDPSALTEREQYKLMTGTVVPRPIALVTTLGPQGPNAAPFSLFNIAGTDPPMVFLCVGDQDDGVEKDTLQNMRWNGEFVIHIVDEAMAPKMNICSTDFPTGTNELVEADFETVASVKVVPPRIAESPAHFECRILQIHDVGSRHHIIIGEVVWFHYRDGVVNERLYVDFQKLAPIGRLSGSLYARLDKTFRLDRPYADGRPSGG
jgi:flavin reductase (DIM6/NTAB) family NADH-FMN oxidoreductase RutF